ncbi:histidine phosphotransferase family protein [Tabrizicola oligotrophica]|uniref:Histidine phosphotransferase n=1 Tax=Tabrizicola oligotrophica TaxID=2710650 RepID=A0A6M0QYY3_9RHOB|nr:histidine phosphotransferase family protein [Tabrizicola oligotrophica]NEY92103.1 histidine phosphotransferase [Tabrizicola oligotrophica]
MLDKPDIAALLGSRICHDLISPIGAISNGVELLLMDGMAKGPEMTLVAESVAHANARIRFFRVAFGQTSMDQRIGLAEVRSILGDLARGSRITVDWHAPPDLSRRETKLAFLCLLCLETALGQGGRITVERGEARWTLTGSAPRLRIDPDLWETLSNPQAGAEVGAGQVQFMLVPDEIARQHRRLTVEISETEIRLTF